MQPGSKIGSYQIVAPLGAGGMGEVYRAHDSKLRRDVAIKVLPAASAADSERLARLTREARILAALNHPNIASVYGLEDDAGHTGVVMELVEGRSLADVMAQAGRSGLPFPRALAIARQIVNALDAAHEKGITHRDLKPANVMIGADDAVKVLDFGLASARRAATAQDAATISVLSTAGQVAGTAAYMSPEQARGAEVDKRTDIWAFGCVLFEMLTGRRAFDGATGSDQIAGVLTREPDWSALPAATPAAVRRLLQRCLEKDSKRRLRDIGDVELLLDDESRTSAAQTRSVAWLPWTIAAVAALVTIGVLFRGRVARPITSTVPVRFQIPATVNLAESQQFSVSPDGRHLVFAGAGSDGVMRLWVRNFDSLETYPLAGTESDVVDLIPPMLWSPDSRFVAYDNRGQLKKLPIAGGEPQVVCRLNGFGVGGSWNRDNVILMGNVSGGIVRCPANGGVAADVTALDRSRAEESHLLPAFLPDGRHFLYLAISRTARENSGIYLTSIDGGDRQLIVETTLGPAQFVPDEGTSFNGHILFARGPKVFALPFDTRALRATGEAVPVVDEVGSYRDSANFSASANGVLVYRSATRPVALTWLDRRGVPGAPITAAGRYANLSLSPDGKRAAVARQDPMRQPDQDIWVFDLETGGGTPVTFSPLAEEMPIWFPNSHDVVFRSVGPNLVVKPVDGTAAERIIYSSPRQKFPTDISLDGEWMLFHEQTLDPTRKTDVFAVRVAGGQPESLVASPLEQSQAVFAPDRRSIAYVSNETGANEVFVQALQPPVAAGGANSGRQLVSKGGGTAPRWRRDGKELFYLGPDGTLMSSACETAVAVHCAAPKALFKVPAAQSGWGVAPDGERFLFALPSGTSQPEPFTVVLDWPAALRPK